MDTDSTKVPTPLPQDALAQKKTALESQTRNGANWFLWIAALSLINTAIFLSGNDWNFVVSLGITQVIDVTISIVTEDFSQTTATVARLIGLVADFIVIGIFLLLGVLGRRQHRWPMIIGMVLYALDGVISVLVTDILGILFHAFALYCLWRGLHAMKQLRVLEKTQQAQSLGIL